MATSIYYNELSPSEQKEYKTKLLRISFKDPYALPESSFTNDIDKFPDVTYMGAWAAIFQNV